MNLFELLLYHAESDDEMLDVFRFNTSLIWPALPPLYKTLTDWESKVRLGVAMSLIARESGMEEDVRESLLLDCMVLYDQVSSLSHDHQPTPQGISTGACFVLEKLGDLMARGGRYQFGVLAIEASGKGHSMRKDLTSQYRLSRQLSSLTVSHGDVARSLTYNSSMMERSISDNKLNEFVYVSEVLSKILLEQGLSWVALQFLLVSSYLLTGACSLKHILFKKTNLDPFVKNEIPVPYLHDLSKPLLLSLQTKTESRNESLSRYSTPSPEKSSLSHLLDSQQLNLHIKIAKALMTVSCYSVAIYLLHWLLKRKIPSQVRGDVLLMLSRCYLKIRRLGAAEACLRRILIESDHVLLQMEKEALDTTNDSSTSENPRSDSNASEHHMRSSHHHYHAPHPSHFKSIGGMGDYPMLLPTSSSNTSGVTTGPSTAMISMSQSVDFLVCFARIRFAAKDPYSSLRFLRIANSVCSKGKFGVLARIHYLQGRSYQLLCVRCHQDSSNVSAAEASKEYEFATNAETAYRESYRLYRSTDDVVHQVKCLFRIVQLHLSRFFTEIAFQNIPLESCLDGTGREVVESIEGIATTSLELSGDTASPILLLQCLVNAAELHWVCGRGSHASSAWREAQSLLTFTYLQRSSSQYKLAQPLSSSTLPSNKKPLAFPPLPPVEHPPGLLLRIQEILTRIIRLAFVLKPNPLPQFSHLLVSWIRLDDATHIKINQTEGWLEEVFPSALEHHQTSPSIGSHFSEEKSVDDPTTPRKRGHRRNVEKSPDLQRMDSGGSVPSTTTYDEGNSRFDGGGMFTSDDDGLSDKAWADHMWILRILHRSIEHCKRNDDTGGDDYLATISQIRGHLSSPACIGERSFVPLVAMDSRGELVDTDVAIWAREALEGWGKKLANAPQRVGSLRDLSVVKSESGFSVETKNPLQRTQVSTRHLNSLSSMTNQNQTATSSFIISNSHQSDQGDIQSMLRTVMNQLQSYEQYQVHKKSILQTPPSPRISHNQERTLLLSKQVISNCFIRLNILATQYVTGKIPLNIYYEANLKALQTLVKFSMDISGVSNLVQEVTSRTSFMDSLSTNMLGSFESKEVDETKGDVSVRFNENVLVSNPSFNEKKSQEEGGGGRGGGGGLSGRGVMSTRFAKSPLDRYNDLTTSSSSSQNKGVFSTDSNLLSQSTKNSSRDIDDFNVKISGGFKTRDSIISSSSYYYPSFQFLLFIDSTILYYSPSTSTSLISPVKGATRASELQLLGRPSLLSGLNPQEMGSLEDEEEMKDDHMIDFDPNHALATLSSLHSLPLAPEIEHEMPPADDTLIYLVQKLGYQHILFLLNTLLLEQPLLVLVSPGSEEELCLALVALLRLIRPFKWQYPFLPLSHLSSFHILLSLISQKIPFISGAYHSTIEAILPSTPQSKKGAIKAIRKRTLTQEQNHVDSSPENVKEEYLEFEEDLMLRIRQCSLFDHVVVVDLDVGVVKRSNKLQFAASATMSGCPAPDADPVLLHFMINQFNHVIDMATKVKSKIHSSYVFGDGNQDQLRFFDLMPPLPSRYRHTLSLKLDMAIESSTLHDPFFASSDLNPSSSSNSSRDPPGHKRNNSASSNQSSASSTEIHEDMEDQQRNCGLQPVMDEFAAIRVSEALRGGCILMMVSLLKGLTLFSEEGRDPYSQNNQSGKSYFNQHEEEKLFETSPKSPTDQNSVVTNHISYHQNSNEGATPSLVWMSASSLIPDDYTSFLPTSPSNNFHNSNFDTSSLLAFVKDDVKPFMTSLIQTRSFQVCYIFLLLVIYVYFYHYDL